jgi:hypothetical protein
LRFEQLFNKKFNIPVLLSSNNNMDTQIRPIEERLEEAKQELARAQSIVSRYEEIQKKKKELQGRFRELYALTPQEIKVETRRDQYGLTFDGRTGYGDILPLGKVDPALEVLYYLKNHDRDFYGDASGVYPLMDRITQTISGHIDKIWQRQLSEPEYTSIVNATEPFIGRYIQRVYDKRQKETEVFQKQIEAEERAYAQTHRMPIRPQIQEEQKIAQTALPQKRASLLRRLFGGKK